MKRIVFDVNGITTYPDFANTVLLTDRLGYKINFWTLGDSKVEIPKLKAMGLDQFTSGLIDKDMTSDLIAIFRNKNYERLPEYISKFGNEPTIAEIQRVIDEGGKWIETLDFFGIKNGDRNIKFPAILGEEPILLVESDRFDLDENSEHTFTLNESSRQIDYYKIIMTDSAGMSLAVLPEHPQIWKGPLMQIKPEQIIYYLNELITNWNGDQLYINIGDVTQIYEESSTRIERRMLRYL